MCDGIKAGELLVAHIGAIRTIKGFERANAIVIIESNYYGWAPQLIRHVQLSPTRNVTFMRQDMVANSDGEIRPGSRTTKENKVLMSEMLVSLVDHHYLLLHRHFQTAMPELSLYPDLIAELCRQMHTYMRVSEPNSHNPLARASITYTGKLTGKDDMVMTLAIAVFNYNIWMTDPRYAIQRVTGGHN